MFFLAQKVNTLFCASMGNNTTKEPLVIKKGEAGKMFGFRPTAAYKYMDHLVMHDCIKEVRLPGIVQPRFKRQDVLDLLSGETEIEIPEFKTN